MRSLRDPADLGTIADAELHALLEQRFADLCPEEAYDPEVNGFFVLVEAGDAVEDLEAEIGCPILRSVDGQRYGMAGFQPCFELVEEHATVFEMVFVPGDGDFGIVVIVPKAPGIDAELLQLCLEYATPSPVVKAS